MVSFQLWALGYHQSSKSYNSQEDVLNITTSMLVNKMPVDAIWMYGDYTDGYRWFKWNHTAYPDPVNMQKNMSSLNKVSVAISDPPIKIDNNYNVYKNAQGKYFVRWVNGTDYQGMFILKYLF